jgi:hypothetical protein
VTPSTALLRREHTVVELVEWSAVPRRMVLVWGALFLNVLAFYGVPILVPIPATIGQMLAQGALPVALGLALIVNRNLVVRPSLVLALLSVGAITALMTSVHNEFMLSSTFRACRLVGFVTVLWLLTPWFGRRDMLLLRCHRRVLWIITGSVLLGAALSPGLAFSFEGRLAGVIWPIPATQVAHYAAILFGTTAVLWMCRVISGRHALVGLALTFFVLMGTHTRTALLATAVGLVFAGASLFLGHARVRRTSALGAVAAVLMATVFASEIMNWALRGQTPQEAGQLTGRTKVWSAVFATPRTRMEEIFGNGLSDQSFNGLPIDSNWVASYWDLGWFGLILQVTVLLVLLMMAATHVRGPQRACALFIVVYAIVASFTETTLVTPSPYILDLIVAASLLTPEARGGRE